MLTKKPALLLATYTSLHAAPFAPPWSTSPFAHSTRQRRARKHRSHAYATIANDPGDPPTSREKDGPCDHIWPKPPKGHSCPTPYQILETKSRATYSKARFYELVKLYHPDLSHGRTDHMARHMKMERYRLIVAAHNILSDPVKRIAYDRFGAGWSGKADIGDRGAWSGAHPPGPFSHSWSDPSDPIWSNATWEDWERFHARREREQNPKAPPADPQSPLFLSNSYFLALILILAFMGGSANYNRAQDAGTHFVNQRDIVHDRAAKDLRRVRQELSDLKGRQERIQWFVRQREATLGAFSDGDVEAWRDEKASRLLPDRKVCNSEGISEKDS